MHVVGRRLGARHRARRVSTMKALAGIVIVALHAAGYVWLVERSAGEELVVELAEPMSIEGTANTARAHITTDTRPGIQRRRWTTSYRGGFAREVGATALVG